ncbi:hypothetical protein ACX1DX_14055 [Tessaracoccus sp. Y36]
MNWVTVRSAVDWVTALLSDALTALVTPDGAQYTPPHSGITTGHGQLPSHSWAEGGTADEALGGRLVAQRSP